MMALMVCGYLGGTVVQVYVEVQTGSMVTVGAPLYRPNEKTAASLPKFGSAVLLTALIGSRASPGPFSVCCSRSVISPLRTRV